MKAPFVFLTMVVLATGGERTFIDKIGFSTTKEQIQAVIECSKENPDATAVEVNLPASQMIAAICPHDDHIYAGPLYLPVMERVKAKHLILIGVFHKAKKFNAEDVLVFDDFQTWKGPLGPLPVDTALRSAVIKDLPKQDFVVNNEYHQEEHSLEAFVGFIEALDPGASILPILVPYMGWERMDQLALDLSRAVSKAMKENRWKWGEDVQIIISNDSVHYGDQGWGGKNYAPFGAGMAGLMKAKEQDQGIIREYLTGSIEPSKLKKLLYTLADEKDIHEYKITWCGRFSIPFGMDFIYHLSGAEGQQAPRGWFMGYGTSVELGELPVRELGLGVTAPANLHHWVAYTSIGFFNP